MKPTDLDDPSPVEPDGAVLDRVHERSGAYRRRRRAQRVMSIGAGALLVVSAVAIALAVGRGGGTRPSEPSPTTTTTVPAVTNADIVGTWRPVSIADYDGSLTSPPLASVPTVRFGANNKLQGDDTCNGFGGDYELRPDGSFHQRGLSSTLVGCLRRTPPLLDVISKTTRVELHDGRMALLASDGHELAQLVRAVATTRIELPSNTMVAGSTMKGRVVVDNETGRVIPAYGCGSLFAVALSNAGYQPTIGWYLCRHALDIPTGVSTYPVVVEASILAVGAQGPLPAGMYEATLYQSTHFVPDPPALRIEVVAPR